MPAEASGVERGRLLGAAVDWATYLKVGLASRPLLKVQVDALGRRLRECRILKGILLGYGHYSRV
jgi:hypothetical protein